MSNIVNPKLYGIVCFFLLVAGCGGGGATLYDPYQGTEGVRLSFISGIPPHEIYEGDEIEIALSVENKGSYDITQGYISIITESPVLKTRAYDKEFTYNQPLAGKNKFSNVGESAIFSVQAVAGSMQDFSGVDTQIIASACYAYQTYLSTEVCIDPNPYDVGYVKPCQVKTLTFSGQGAPVGIVQVEPRLSTRVNDYGDRSVIPMFLLYVRQVQPGEIINRFKLEDMCGSGEVTHADYGEVQVRASLGNAALACKPSPLHISQYTGEEFQGNVVRCEYQGEIPDSIDTYTGVLNVWLDYGFSTKTNRRITILNT